MKAIKEDNKKREEEEEKKKKLQKLQKKDDKKNKLYPGKAKNKNMEEDDEFNENRYTNCFKKYFTTNNYPTCLEFSP